MASISFVQAAPRQNISRSRFGHRVALRASTTIVVAIIGLAGMTATASCDPRHPPAPCSRLVGIGATRGVVIIPCDTVNRPSNSPHAGS